MQSNTVLSSKVFSREGVFTKSKNPLSLSISFSQLYYNRHTASGSNATVTIRYKTIHMRIARSVAGQHKIPGFDVDTDAVVLAKSCLPSAEVFQSLARLRDLGRLYVAAPDYLLALIELASKHKSGWFHLVTGHLLVEICWSFHPRLSRGTCRLHSGLAREMEEASQEHRIHAHPASKSARPRSPDARAILSEVF